MPERMYWASGICQTGSARPSGSPGALLALTSAPAAMPASRAAGLFRCREPMRRCLRKRKSSCLERAGAASHGPVGAHALDVLVVELGRALKVADLGVDSAMVPYASASPTWSPIAPLISSTRCRCWMAVRCWPCRGAWERA